MPVRFGTRTGVEHGPGPATSTASRAACGCGPSAFSKRLCPLSWRGSSRGPDGGTWDYARTLFDAIEAIGFEVGQGFGCPRWPEDLYLVGAAVIGQAEVKSEIALRQITA